MATSGLVSFVRPGTTGDGFAEYCWERRPRPAPGCWDTQMPYVMTRVLARGVKESPGADPKAIVPSYCEECYETALPQVWAVTRVIAATRWYKP